MNAYIAKDPNCGVCAMANALSAHCKDHCTCPRSSFGTATFSWFLNGVLKTSTTTTRRRKGAKKR